jgi:hypothetical protein
MPPPDPRLDPVLDETRIAQIEEAPRKSMNEPKATADVAQQKRSRIGLYKATIKIGHHRTPLIRFKFKKPCATI